MKTWDVIIVGGGIIGLALSIELQRKGANVLVVERGEPGREASYAAGGMLADGIETPAALHELAAASAQIYPEFVRELQTESEVNCDLRDQGTIVFHKSESSEEVPGFAEAHSLPAPLGQLEPVLTASNLAAFFFRERSVDPRGITAAAFATAKHRRVDISSGEEVTSLELSDGRLNGVVTKKTRYHAPNVVNCAGAWSGQIAPYRFPTRPVKGQMLCLLSPPRVLLKHVIRTPEVYLIPRTDGRVVVGTTVEEAGFDKRTDIATIQRLHQAAIAVVPELRNAKILEDWAGLRPGTPDDLPILGETLTSGYYVATGHFRDGILLAPITAQVMAQVIGGKNPEYNLQAFSPARFPQAG